MVLSDSGYEDAWQTCSSAEFYSTGLTQRPGIQELIPNESNRSYMWCYMSSGMCRGKNAIDLKVEVPIMKKQFRAKCEVNLNGGKYILKIPLLLFYWNSHCNLYF